jgi:squalene-associated FAD-dependent desaturase
MEHSALTSDVIVIGAGFAGLSAAVRLAAAGRSVVVCEEAPRLGGRATAFTDRDTGERVDNGQHVLFGCYRETYAFLREIGTDGLAPLQRRLAVTMADTAGRSSSLVCPRWPPPAHLFGGVLMWRALSVRERLRVVKLRRFFSEVRRAGPEAAAARVRPDDTVSRWLALHGQTGRLRDWLWNPLAVAALNQSPETAAAAPFARVLGELFGPRAEDSSIGLPAVPLDELYAEPARAYLEHRGCAVLTRSPARVRVVERADRPIVVTAGGRRFDAHAVISSVPWHALGRIWDGEPPAALGQTLANAAATTSSPIVTVNLWFDGAVTPHPFVGLVGGPMHWVFDKSAIFGSAAGHLSVVASGAVELAAMDNAAITREALAHLTKALPAAATRTLLRSVVVREQRATFSLAPGGPPRPAARTAVRGFHLAGDWTDTGLPGTIEGAVMSGHRAADEVLAWRGSR